MIRFISMRKRTIVMAILDGWGIGPKDYSNAIYIAKPRFIEYIKHTYPAGTIQASGIAVGLPWGEKGDSEVGHLTLGAGKILYQHYPRINIAIDDGTFFKNDAFLQAINHAKRNSSNLNIVGLLSKNNIQSSLKHLEALLKLAEKEELSNINLHLFTDGKDSPPKSASDLLKSLPQENIASLSGRYFAMDTDLHWDRTVKVYKTLTTTKSKKVVSAETFLQDSYKGGANDEYIEPTLLNPEKNIKPNDSIIFFNFREDGIRQLAEMFVNPNSGEPHQIPQNLYITTLTDYGSMFNFSVAFPPEIVTDPLGKTLAEANKVQLRIAETVKYAHVTYFFNGFREKAFKNEYRVLIPSKNVARFDDYPEMMAKEITTRALTAISEGVYDFILVNYANADAVSHTGNFEAATKAINIVDEQIGLLMNASLESGGMLVITSDHGNAEQMIDKQTGMPETTHDPNPVPIYVVAKGYERAKDDVNIKSIERSNIGTLADVAPTILELMGVPKHPGMTGVSLLQSLR